MISPLHAIFLIHRKNEIFTLDPLFISSQKAFEVLEDLLAQNNICLAVKEKLTKDSGVAAAEGFDNIVLKLLSKRRARG